ncbi:hypothetical protein [Streptomyces sp. NPDC002580]|uniref:hypothetical protein n=1 Tax=Streptomyces sp. NPDC002580 TaxID=3364653 RepID=UPI0036BCB9C7
MAIIRARGVRLGMPAVAVAVLLAGCGTQRPVDDVEGAGPSGTTSAAPSGPVDHRCPGEEAAPEPSGTAASAAPGPADTAASTAPGQSATGAPAGAGPATPNADHYAENHGFMVPLPLHGRERCEGLAAVRRVEKALEPLRERGDFTPDGADRALAGLGYDAEQVRVHRLGPNGVSFLLDAAPLCVEGTMGPDGTRAEAFGGYPDHTGCDRPSGGH